MPRWNVAQRRAVIKYGKENLVRYSFALNRKKDYALIRYLDTIPNKNQLIKRMLYQAMLHKIT